MKYTSAFSVVAFLAVACTTVLGEGPVVVSDTLGTFHGKYLSVQQVEYEAYLGIRYALAPINDLRFAKPVASGHLGDVKATAYGHRCPQPFILPSGLGNATIDEDCLNLNVYRKKGTSATSKKAVIIVIHGGGFSVGSSGDLMYNAGPMAALGDVVTVSMNYRLGFLGFADMEGFAPGNLGLWDQRLVFEWVRDNIESFGGDPQQVTLMGVSAGSMSISAHIVSPLNVHCNLFQSVIMDAGIDVPALYGTSKETYERVKKLGEKAGCTSEGEDLVACLRKVEADKLVELSLDPEGFSPILTYFPTADGAYIPTYMKDPLSTHVKQFTQVRMLTGYSANEGSLFAFYYFDPVAHPPQVLDTEERLVSYLANISRAYVYHLDMSVESVKKTVLDTFSLKPGGMEVYAGIGRFMTDGSFACPMNSFIKTYATVHKRVYGYHWGRVLAGTYLFINPQMFGAYHLSTFLTLSGALLADPNTQVDPADLPWFLDGIRTVTKFAAGSHDNSAPLFRGVQFPDLSTGGGVLHFVNGKDKPEVLQDFPFQNECKAVFGYYG